MRFQNASETESQGAKGNDVGQRVKIDHHERNANNPALNTIVASLVVA